MRHGVVASRFLMGEWFLLSGMVLWFSFAGMDLPTPLWGTWFAMMCLAFALEGLGAKRTGFALSWIIVLTGLAYTGWRLLGAG